MLKKVLVLVLVLVLLVRPSLEVISPEKQQELDDFLNQILNCTGIPGASVAVVQDNEVIINQGYGYANLDEQLPVYPHTKFAVGSLTKAFAASLIAVLLSKDDRYTWDTPVRDILGEDFYFSTGYHSNHTILRDVLGMRTGLPTNTNLILLDQFSLEELVSRLRFFDPIVPFRTEWVYQNMMYGVAGYIGEKMGGVPWYDLLKTHLLDPIGMKSTTMIDRAPPDYEGFATPYVTREDGPEVVPLENYVGSRSGGAAGFVASSADDMALWMKFWLNDAITPDGTIVLPRHELAEFWKPEISVSMPRSVKEIFYAPAEKYAKGWFTGFYRENRLLSHSGALRGYSSRIHLLPERRFGSFIIFNHSNLGLSARILLFINDLLLGEEQWVTADDLCAMVPSVSQPKIHFPSVPIMKENILDEDTCEKSTFKKLVAFCKFLKSKGFYHSDRVTDKDLLLDDYVGEFGNFGFGNITILLSDELLQMRFGSFGSFSLTPVTGDVFYTEGNGNPSYLYNLGPVYFQRSPTDGTVDQLSVPHLDEDVQPTFIRDLKLANAPDPDIESCYQLSQTVPHPSSSANIQAPNLLLCSLFLSIVQLILKTT